MLNHIHKTESENRGRKCKDYTKYKREIIKWHRGISGRQSTRHTLREKPQGLSVSLEERRQTKAKKTAAWVFLHISELLKRDCGHFHWTEKERKLKQKRSVRYADDFMWNPPEASAWRVQGSCNTSLKHADGRMDAVALDVKQIPKQKSRTERRR